MSRMGSRRSWGGTAAAMLVLSAGGIWVAQAPAYAASAVQGSAFGYYTNVSLFGGPAIRLGYGQAAGAPAVAASPSVALPPGGGAAVVNDADGSKAAYGPAVIFGMYDAGTNTFVSSGAETVTAGGMPSGRGAVATRAVVVNASPGPLLMPQVAATCTQLGATVVRTVQVTNGLVETSTDPRTARATSLQPIPPNPPPGFRVDGTINQVGEHFHIVFNEQTTNADGSHTVVGAHMYLDGPQALGDMVVASATCGITP